MNANTYKWQLRFTHPHKGEGLTLVPLRCAPEIPKDYVHKPGDIDYTDLKHLSYEVKTDVMHYLNQGYVPDDSRREAAAIAACIMVDRITDPKFTPAELPPKLCKE